MISRSASTRGKWRLTTSPMMSAWILVIVASCLGSAAHRRVQAISLEAEVETKEARGQGGRIRGGRLSGLFKKLVGVDDGNLGPNKKAGAGTAEDGREFEVGSEEGSEEKSPMDWTPKKEDADSTRDGVDQEFGSGVNPSSVKKLLHRHRTNMGGAPTVSSKAEKGGGSSKSEKNKRKVGGTPPSLDKGAWWLSAGANFLRTMGAIHPDGNGGASTEFDFDFYGGSNKWRDTLDSLNETGVTIVGLHAVYDSGLNPRLQQTYDPDCLWNGLAIGDLKKVNPMFASAPDAGDEEDNLKTFIDYAHNIGLKVISWANLSYFQIGGLWKQAAADIERYVNGGINIPSDSPANWFVWTEGATLCWCQEYKELPAKYNGACPDTAETDWLVAGSLSDNGTPNEACGGDEDFKLRWSEDANACIETVWARTPSANYASDDWKEYVKEAMEKYIGMGLDGIYLDAPDCYAEYNNGEHLMLLDWYKGGYSSPSFSRVMEEVREYGFSKDKNIPILSENYHFDEKGSVFSKFLSLQVGLWGWDGGPGGVGEYDDFALFKAIIEMDAQALDMWYTGVDNAHFTSLYSTPGMNSDTSKPVYYTAALQRVPMFKYENWVKQSTRLNALMVALAQAGGYVTAVEYVIPFTPLRCHSDIVSGKQPPTCVGAEIGTDKLWWARIEDKYPGQITTSHMLRRLGLDQNSGEDNFATPEVLRAFAYNSDKPYMHGLLKYDSFGTGKLALFVTNLSNGRVVDATLDAAFLYGLNYVDIGFGTDKLAVDPQSMEVVVGSKNIGTWYEVGRDDGNGWYGHLNCYPGHGVDDLSLNGYFEEWPDQTTVAGCMLACLGKKGSCTSVTVNWINLFDGSGNPGKVMCWLHSEVTDVNACDASPNPDDFGEYQYQTFSLE